jgi:beta-galactosidase
MGLSEYGAGACIDQHQDPPSQPVPYGPFHPEEWQNLFHEGYLSAMEQRPYLWARFIWNMFDFASASRNEGSTPGRNDKGLVTYDRKTRKDAFFFYKSHWNPTPTVYITSRRFVNRPSQNVSVKVYSNRDTVELFVNGVSQGVMRKSGDMVFHFPNLVLKSGANTVKAVGTTAGSATADSVVWNAP